MEAILNQQSHNGHANGGSGEPAGTRKFGLTTSTTSHPEHEGGDIDSPVTSPVSSPPYWVQSHTRSFSVESIPAGAITLQDNTDEGDTKNKACWARSVYIEDHVIINGSRTGIGAFVVWNITVETLRVGLECWIRRCVVREC